MRNLTAELGKPATGKNIGRTAEGLLPCGLAEEETRFKKRAEARDSSCFSFQCRSHTTPFSFAKVVPDEVLKQVFRPARPVQSIKNVQTHSK